MGRKNKVSFAKFERGKFIKSRMMQILICRAPLKEGGGHELFAETWDVISEVSTAGNATTERCSKDKIYLEALRSWQEYLKQKGG